MANHEIDEDDLVPITPEMIALFEGPIGRLVLVTAQLDFEFELLLVAISGLTPITRPPMLGAKFDAARKAFDGAPSLAHLKGDAEALLSQTKSINDFRRLVVHGTLSFQLPGKLPFLVFDKSAHNKRRSMLTMTRMMVPFTLIIDMGNEAVSACAMCRQLRNKIESLRIHPA